MHEKNLGTSKDYTEKNKFWKRVKQTIQSDFLCRPYIFNLLKDVKGQNVIDIGCGDGYVSRYFASHGAKVVGVDNSEGLISVAKQQEEKDHLGIKYFLGSALNLKMIKSNSMDCAVSVLVFGHFNAEEIIKAVNETKRILRKGGCFVLAVPHPFMYVCKPKTKWIKFNYKKLDYFNDKIAEISLYTKDKMKFDISAQHHTFEKYLNSLTDCSFVIEKIIEPKAQKRDISVYPYMWGEEGSLPTYLIIKSKKL